MTDKEKEAIQYIISKINAADEKAITVLNEVDIYKAETLLSIINRQQAELEDARIAVKSFKSKYLNAVKTAKELKTVIKEKEAEIKRLNAKVKSVYEELVRIALMTVPTDRMGV